MSNPKSSPAAGRQPPVPLTTLASGQTGTVVRLGGGRAMQARLLGMGLYVGSEVHVLKAHRGSHGPTLLAVGETRLALGYGMAERILVHRHDGAGKHI